VCTVTGPNCPNYPTYAGTYVDPDSTAQNNVARCSVRAQEYYSWCGTTSPVTTVSTQGTTVLQSTTYPSSVSQASAAQIADLANALTAFEQALQAFLQELK
jgi:hypothetical protein